MTSSTLTLPADIFSTHPGAGRNPLSKSSNSYQVELPVSPAPTLQHRHDYEAVEMSTFRDGVAPTSTPTVQTSEVPAWTMSLRNEWIAIATCCQCMFLVLIYQFDKEVETMLT